MEENQSFSDEHEAFAASRVSQYVYVPTKEVFFTTLDHHADAIEGDVKKPLILVGDEGSGKSALLANWVSKRRQHKHRDEFLFQHFVGCTTPSLQLITTLFRLETALKNFFQLREMKVPDTEEELRWALNRFLAAAAKKHSPTRIVIIIDGVHLLKNESGPDGVLYWLPTELPPGVRFIISTVEFDRNLIKASTESIRPINVANERESFEHKSQMTDTGSDTEGNSKLKHRTFIELNRRHCPLLRMEPLGASTRSTIVSEFEQLTKLAFQLNDHQTVKVVSLHYTKQPMFLRSLLQSLRLTKSLTTIQVDVLLDQFLECHSAHDVIDLSLNLCCDALGGPAFHEAIAKIFSMVYASRNGLTIDEIWGLVRMFVKEQPDENLKKKIYDVLRDFTMVVDDMHLFSHEVFREVVFSKFIKTKDQLIKLHNLLSRFFSQLPSCDRKLVALPYHLEAAGSWSKVKNCLTDIELFQRWWTPKFKVDFIKFWASLTKRTSKNNSGYGSHAKNKKDSSADLDQDRGHSKPSYDIVDEYVKSLDEFRIKLYPADELVANIILEIGDFLLEFAMLGHEANTDVPNFLHPQIPCEDLENVGIPYITVDKKTGRDVLWYPEIFTNYNKKSQGDDGRDDETAAKAIEDISLCTTYFFNRWMWIQFPYVALGNCDRRYSEGVEHKILVTMDYKEKQKKALEDEEARKNSSGDKTKGEDSTKREFDTSAFKLPEIKFNRKAAKSVRRVPAENGTDATVAGADKVTQRLAALQDDILNYKEEHDFIIQMKAIQTKRLAELKGTVEDLKRSGESNSEFEDAIGSAVKREKEAAKKVESVTTLNTNLNRLNVMCDRHPANVPALLEDLQNKIDQDAFLLSEIKKRLWEQEFEKQMHNIYFRRMKNLVQEGVNMHNKLLQFRYDMKKGLLNQQAEDEKKLLLKNSTDTFDEKRSRSEKGHRDTKHHSNKLKDKESNVDSMSLVSHAKSWDETWSIISSRTGVAEPEIFFDRINNGKSLEEQISLLKKTSEARLDFVKKEIVEVEKELDEVRGMTFSGSSSTKEQQKEYEDRVASFKVIKERTELAESLRSKVMAGLVHISEMLGLEQSQNEPPAGDVLRDVEAILDVLMDEREKQIQQVQQANMVASQSSTSGGSSDHKTGMPPSSPEAHHRSPELDFLVSKYEIPKCRLPAKLPSKPESINDISQQTKAQMELDALQNDDFEEGTWDRAYVKNASLKNLRAEQKKMAKEKKELSRSVDGL